MPSGSATTWRPARHDPSERSRKLTPFAWRAERSQPLHHLRRHIAAEREAAEVEPPPGPPRAAPRDDRKGIGALADAVGIGSFRCPDSAEIEPNDVRAKLHERAGERGHHFVVHRALLQRVGMADDCDRSRLRTDRVYCGFERADGPRYRLAQRRDDAPRHLGTRLSAVIASSFGRHSRRGARDRPLPRDGRLIVRSGRAPLTAR